MTDLETQVRVALDQLAAMVKHDGFCSAGECLRCRETNQRPDLHHPCTCNREVRLRAAWSQATARAAHKLAKEFAEENVNEFGCGTPEEIVAVTTSNESEFVAALRESV